MINRNRTAIAAIVVSASALVALVMDEGYTDTAVIPVKGDRWTVGHGSTFREDGTPVQPGDTITPPKAIARTLAHIQKDESQIKRCVTAPLSQVEYDLMVDFAYQYGTKALCASTIVREANAGNYEASCRGYLLYKRAGGYDCSTPGNRRCPGVWTRSQERYRKCTGAT
jgi:lysozyme